MYHNECQLQLESMTHSCGNRPKHSLTWNTVPIISIFPMTMSTGSCASMWPIGVRPSSLFRAPYPAASAGKGGKEDIQIHTAIMLSCLTATNFTDFQQVLSVSNHGNTTFSGTQTYALSMQNQSVYIQFASYVPVPSESKWLFQYLSWRVAPKREI